MHEPLRSGGRPRVIGAGPAREKYVYHFVAKSLFCRQPFLARAARPPNTFQAENVTSLAVRFQTGTR